MKQKKSVHNIAYKSIIDPCKVFEVYINIKRKTKFKTKHINYDMFLTANISYIINTLNNKNYKHGIYNVFMITRPKPRIIMSECLHDKVINHLLSEYVFLPLLEPRLIETNVATRKNKGTKAGIYYMKKYINAMKNKYKDFYILKCDIKKFFYSIDHEILLNKLKKIIRDADLFNVTAEIINSTNYDYINRNINKVKVQFINIINSMNISSREKQLLINNILAIPEYEFNKGLPIGNMSSQIFAIFYLNDLDHFIKECLKIKYYIRYMDDFILFHNDKKYLKECYREIQKFLLKEKLVINKKTQIISMRNGINFLGYRFVIKNNKTYVLMTSHNKRMIFKSHQITNYGGYLHYLTNKINTT